MPCLSDFLVLFGLLPSIILALNLVNYLIRLIVLFLSGGGAHFQFFSE